MVGRERCAAGSTLRIIMLCTRAAGTSYSQDLKGGDNNRIREKKVSVHTHAHTPTQTHWPELALAHALADKTHNIIMLSQELRVCLHGVNV